MLILISGPYRSGTNDNPEKMAANQNALEAASWPIFQPGYIPMIGEWVAQPVRRAAGGKLPGDDLHEEIFCPAAERLISICDAVLRLSGDGRGADNDVEQAKA
ncbi:DUF4406 domain-containing protein [Roseibium album]|uniref:DUF4406 domain-containing protein n=1 Tax=Roseibium album TaxID=311410 RepID=UPI003BB0D06A